MSKGTVSFGFLSEVTDDLELYKSLIFQYSVSRYTRGDAAFILRPQLISLLALYFKLGYNRDSKDLAASILGIKRSSIDTMNLDLKNGKYLIDDDINKRVKTLNPELIALKDYVATVTNGRYNIVHIVQMSQKSVNG